MVKSAWLDCLQAARSSVGKSPESHRTSFIAQDAGKKSQGKAAVTSLSELARGGRRGLVSRGGSRFINSQTRPPHAKKSLVGPLGSSSSQQGSIVVCTIQPTTSTYAR